MNRKPTPHARRNLKIRPANLHDIGCLVHHRRAMWEDLGINMKRPLEWGDRVYRQWALSRLNSNRLVAWVVEDEQKTLVGGGCLWLQPIQPRPHDRNAMLQPYLLSMYTEKKFRRRGVGSMIVREAIGWCKKKGYQRLALHASPMGRGVYKRLGFKRTWEMRLDIR